MQKAYSLLQRHALFGFALLGLALWLLQSTLIDAKPGPVVNVSPDTVEKIRTTWERKHKRIPNPEQLQLAIDEHVEDMLIIDMALEADLDQTDPVVQMRLQKNARFLMQDEVFEVKEIDGTKEDMLRNDPIIKRRLLQRMHELIRSNAKIGAPSDNQLVTYLNNNAHQYMRKQQWSLRILHITAGSDEYQNELAEQVSSYLATGAKAEDVRRKLALGFSSIPTQFNNASDKMISRYLGDSFVNQLSSLPKAMWSTPIKTAFGTHLVYLESHKAPTMPSIDEVRQSLRFNWHEHQAELALQDYRRNLRERAQVNI